LPDWGEELIVRMKPGRLETHNGGSESITAYAFGRRKAVLLNTEFYLSLVGILVLVLQLSYRPGSLGHSSPPLILGILRAPGELCRGEGEFS
jgi:hypothetical protein